MSTADTADLEPREPGVTCPTCGASAPWQRNPHRPFCSLTCRLVDLGVWLDEGYRVPADERDVS
ncbi:MAG: DNA gyrase inhibitor YacG [Candidatus Rokuibacteriota bacterium]|nr:MAG: DNA gyrase inhibitor YacG [Candidatus Rokubacteria bacterium]